MGTASAGAIAPVRRSRSKRLSPSGASGSNRPRSRRAAIASCPSTRWAPAAAGPPGAGQRVLLGGRDLTLKESVTAALRAEALLALAESVQRGLEFPADDTEAAAPSPALATFRQSIARLLPGGARAAGDPA